MEKIKLGLGVGDTISTINVKNFTLLVCYGSEYGIDQDNSTIQEAIESNIEEAFNSMIKKLDDKSYFLEIKPNIKYGNFPWRDGWSKNLLNKQLSIYMPLIQKFIADAMTDTL